MLASLGSEGGTPHLCQQRVTLEVDGDLVTVHKLYDWWSTVILVRIVVIGTSSHHSSLCVQLYSTSAIRGALDIVLNPHRFSAFWLRSKCSLESPQNGRECLLRQEDLRFTTALILSKQD